MRRVVPLLIVLSLGFAPAPVYRERPDTRADLERMQGEWRMTRYVSDGWSRPKKDFFPIGLDGVRLSGVSTPPVEVTLDAKANPKRIDMKVSSGRTIEGIYRLEGDEVTICWESPRLAPVAHTPRRPKDFEANPGVVLTCRLKR
jgi:uncharacterized protein (TIGR03067 family)